MSEDEDNLGNKTRVDINRPFLNLLNKILPTVYLELVNLDFAPHDLWNALNSLTDSMPDDMEKELSKNRKEIQDKMNEIKDTTKTKITVLNIKGLKPAHSIINEVIEGNKDYDKRKMIKGLEQIYLRSVLRSFYRNVFFTLDKHGYLELTRGYGNIPSSNMNL